MQFEPVGCVDITTEADHREQFALAYNQTIVFKDDKGFSSLSKPFEIKLATKPHAISQ